MPAPRLEPDAISVAQDTFIGAALVGPSVSVALTLAALAATTAYAGPAVLALTAIPMIVIANTYRRLNLWNANCGASFEWVGRAINPYLGFLTGWLMAAGTLIGTLSPVVVLAPSILAIFNQSTTSKVSNVAIATGISVIMLIIAVAGIRLSARTQVAIGVIEYADPDCPIDMGAVMGPRASRGNVRHYSLMVQPARHRRKGQPGGRLPYYRLHV